MGHVPARAFYFDSENPGTLILTGAAVLCGWAVRETTGSAVASMGVFDGNAGDAPAIATIDLLKSESTREWFGPNGIELRQGCDVEISTGDIAGAIFLIAGERYDQYMLLQGLRETARMES